MPSKLQLSQTETDLVRNTDWILTKHEIIKKVYELLGELYLFQQNEVSHNEKVFPENAIKRSGKISKGDNYRGLPYVILDYPASFEKENLFIVRTMFWWGNFFSVTLHLSGQNIERIKQDPKELFAFLQQHNFFVCVNEEEWQHHFEENNYVPVTGLSQKDLEKFYECKFLKVAKKISLNEIDNVHSFLTETFREIIALLQINYPAGKTGPLPAFPTTGFGL